MKVLLACKETVVSDGLGALIEGFGSEFTIVGKTRSAAEALELTREHSPDVVLLTLQLEDRNGVDTTTALLELELDTNILLLTSDPHMEPVAEALQAGATGCISTLSGEKHLLEAMRAIQSGKGYLCPETQDAVINTIASDGDSADPVFNLLTPREREVMRHLAEGYGSKEVGAKLHISPKTVDSHRQRIMEKLAIDNIADLVKIAIRAGLTDLSE